MISDTANQLAVFSRLILIGSAFGGAYGIITFLTAVIKEELLLKGSVDVMFGIMSGVAVVGFFLRTDHVKYALFLPISYAVGFLMGKIIVSTALANISALVYNKKKRNEEE